MASLYCLEGMGKGGEGATNFSERKETFDACINQKKRVGADMHRRRIEAVRTARKQTHYTLYSAAKDIL